MDLTPPQVVELRKKIPGLQADIKHWDWIQKAYMLDPKYAKIAQDNIKYKIRSIDHQIVKYICTFTAPVKEADWDQPNVQTPAQFIDMCERIARFERLRKTGYI